MSNLLLSLPLLNCPFDKMCHILVQKHTLFRAFSGLVQTCQLQPPKGKKSEILNLELGKVVQRNGSKTRIVVNFNTEGLNLNHILVPFGSKKMTRERIDLFVFSLGCTIS